MKKRHLWLRQTLSIPISCFEDKISKICTCTKIKPPLSPQHPMQQWWLPNQWKRRRRHHHHHHQGHMRCRRLNRQPRPRHRLRKAPPLHPRRPRPWSPMHNRILIPPLLLQPLHQQQLVVVVVWESLAQLWIRAVEVLATIEDRANQ